MNGALALLWVLIVLDALVWLSMARRWIDAAERECGRGYLGRLIRAAHDPSARWR